MEIFKSLYYKSWVIWMFIFGDIGAFCQQKNFFLTNTYTRGYLEMNLAKDTSWIKYPSYYDRASWEKIPEKIREKSIAEGEKFLGYNWPQVTASMYLEFSRNSNRETVDNVIAKRRVAFASLLMAELMEGKARFLDDIINGVFTICQTTFWGQSAHLYLYGYDEINGSINNPSIVLPDIENPVIDLNTGDVAADLAWAYYFLHREFDKISPVISKRLKSELGRKVLLPYYNRNDFWWISGWKESTKIYREYNWTMNNWTPWITYNMLTCILLIEDDPVKKLDAVYKSMRSIDLFIDCYPDDGACLEGFSYWRRAGGHLLNYLDLLRRATNGKIDIFNQEMIKNRGRFVYRSYIGNGEYYINFANSSLQTHHNPGLIYRFGRAIDDQLLKSFGVFLMERYNFWEEAVQIFPASMGETFENLFTLHDWQLTKPNEPLLREFYFKDSEIAIARDIEGSPNGFCFAAWGNNNGGGHNDNDVGSCVLYFDGQPVFIDKQRVSSSIHNVPLINGIEQGRGGEYKAKNSEFLVSRKSVVFSTDIAAAYLPEAKVNKWQRTYILQRNKKFIVEDDFQLTENKENTRLHFLSALQCTILSLGLLEMDGGKFKLLMKYDPAVLAVSIKPQTGKNEGARIFFDFKKPMISGKVKMEITKLEN